MATTNAYSETTSVVANIIYATHILNRAKAALVHQHRKSDHFFSIDVGMQAILALFKAIE